MSERKSYPISQALYERAQNSLAGGISSEFRRFNPPHPLFYASGHGSHIVDVDGNDYLDFTLSQGPLILGHSHPDVLAAVAQASESGQLFAGQHRAELELAEKLQALIPCAERMRFSLSGSEAVHAALRLARAATGRPKFLRFEGHYHGWLDNVAVSVSAPSEEALGSREHPNPIRWSAGLPAHIEDECLVLPWNDLALVGRTLEAHSQELAAILTEPIMCNSGCIPPEPGFLEGLRTLCDRYGLLLILDEVITGFRIAPGGAQSYFGILPDLAIFGKAMARRMEAEHSHCLAVNVHAGFAFADMRDTGVSFTILSVGESEEASNCLAELCDAAMRTPPGGRTAEMPLEEAMARLAEYASGPTLPGPILLVEPSDNIGGGAPGEGVALLKALITHDIQNAGVIVNDPEAVATLMALAPGDRRTLRFGDTSSPLYGDGCEIEVALVSRSDGRFALEDPRSHLASMVGSHVDMGPCALVRHHGILVLLTSRATPPFDLGQWRSQDIAPEQLFAIGVKAAVAHRQAYDPIAHATLYVDTPGPCRSDLRTLPFQHIRRPIRPLDDL